MLKSERPYRIVTTFVNTVRMPLNIQDFYKALPVGICQFKQIDCRKFPGFSEFYFLRVIVITCVNYVQICI